MKNHEVSQPRGFLSSRKSQTTDHDPFKDSSDPSRLEHLVDLSVDTFEGRCVARCLERVDWVRAEEQCGCCQLDEPLKAD